MHPTFWKINPLSLLLLSFINIFLGDTEFKNRNESYDITEIQNVVTALTLFELINCSCDIFFHMPISA